MSSVPHARTPSSTPDHLFYEVYDTLRLLAAYHLRRERPCHTLSPTALVHEAYLKLRPQTRATFESEQHFLSVAAQAMRRILVDYARRREAEKRGGGAERLTLQTHHALGGAPDLEVLALDQALQVLGGVDPQKRHLVELRYYAGLSPEETADVLGISRATYFRHWRVARAVLLETLRRAA